jgi:hypothetical protein
VKLLYNDYCTVRPAKEVKPFVTIYVPNVLSTTRLEDIRLLLNVSLKLFTSKVQKPEQLMAGVFAL